MGIQPVWLWWQRRRQQRLPCVPNASPTASGHTTNDPELLLYDPEPAHYHPTIPPAPGQHYPTVYPGPAPAFLQLPTTATAAKVQQPCSYRLGQDGRAVATGKGGRTTETETAADPKTLSQPHDREHPHVHCWRCDPTPGRDGSIGGLFLGLWLPLKLQEAWPRIASLPVPLSLSIKWREMTFLFSGQPGWMAGWVAL